MGLWGSGSGGGLQFSKLSCTLLVLHEAPVGNKVMGLMRGGAGSTCAPQGENRVKPDPQ